ncbi:MAG TPA: type II toxin-antitoxin system VapC family toxin [Anaerolineales bacterium]|nr:type II toxin-antitoxin system VapC family toxin [Anaerolineales bacterium]
MNILLDTHVFLWFIDDNPRLSEPARVLIETEDSQPFISMASLWEMAIKISLGKLELEQPYEVFIPQQLALNGIGILNISLEHTAAVATLPFHHRDPFDRLIVVQSKIEKMNLVSADPAFDAYQVQRVW